MNVFSRVKLRVYLSKIRPTFSMKKRSFFKVFKIRCVGGKQIFIIFNRRDYLAGLYTPGMNSTATEALTNSSWSQLLQMIVGLATLAINVHQSYQHRHFHSSCMKDGRECWGITVQSDKDNDIGPVP